MSTIATVQELTATIITPLHIGAGGPPLFDGLDYVSADRIYMIDIERMLAGLSSERLARAENAPKLKEFLTPQEWASYARYSLPNPTGNQRVPELLRQIKTVFGKPYLPGSSLKGAIRTAVAWRLLYDGDVPINRNDLRDNPRFADDNIIGTLFGSNPYRDLFRAMQVADSEPIDATSGLELLRVSLYTLRGKNLTPKGEGWSFFVESLRPGQKLPLRIRIDDYLFEQDIAPRIPFTSPRDTLAGWLHHCHAFSQAIITDEQNFYSAYGPSELVAFYDDLARQAATIQPGREALIQLAWGTGWQSKTIGMHLAKEEMEMVRQTFRLGRAGVNEFPKTRRLIERGGNPSAPLGWIRLRLADHMPDAPVPPTTNATELRASQPERSNVAQQTPVASGTPPRTLADLRPGMVLEGTVTRVTEFGAFINVGVGRDGLLHISQISTKRIEHANAMLSIGQRVRVKVHHVDGDQRKLGLTMRDLQQPEEL